MQCDIIIQDAIVTAENVTLSRITPTADENVDDTKIRELNYHFENVAQL